MSRFFPPNFVTEKAENRDVTLFGSVQNAKVPAREARARVRGSHCEPTERGYSLRSIPEIDPAR